MRPVPVGVTVIVPENSGAEGGVDVEVVVAGGAGLSVGGGVFAPRFWPGRGNSVDDVGAGWGAVVVDVVVDDVVVVGAAAFAFFTRVPSPSRVKTAPAPGATCSDPPTPRMSPPSGNTSVTPFPVNTGTRTLPLALPRLVPG